MPKQAIARQQIEEKALREEQQRLDHEAYLQKMEQEELELIQRLQNTQMLQKAAYEDLEGALQSNSVQAPAGNERPGTASTKGKTKQGSRRV